MKSIIIALLLVATAMSQELPQAPSATRKAHPLLSPFKDPFFYAGTLTATSGVLADVHFVQSCERDHTCMEANPGADTYKRRLPEIGLVVLGDYGCSLMLEGHRWWRAVCALPPIALGLYHWHDTHITYLRSDRLVR